MEDKTMNELIEQLRRQLNKGETTFGDAIQTACKAQRNACVRIYESNWERQYMTKLIKNAEIRKEDYE